MWPCLELTVHILDVRTADYEHVNTRIAESFHALPSTFGVRLAIRHHRAIPVKDEGFIGFVRQHRSAMKSSLVR